MHPIHFTLCNTSPYGRSYDFSLNRLFCLLDSFDVKQRQEILELAYLRHDMEEKKYSDDLWREEWYSDFKKHLIAMNPKSHCEPYVVYGLLMYVLAEAVIKSDVCYFRRTIKGKIKAISECMQHREEVSSNEEVPSHEFEGVYESTAKMIHGSTKAIQKLHQEIEYSKEAYDAFCEQVVKPLLEKRLEGPLTVPELHRDG